jgi:hypothetical protein
MYIAVTNATNSLSPLELRGAKFSMPPSSNFSLLHFEPDALNINEAVNEAFESGEIKVTSMESEEITFAGFGETLLRVDVVRYAASMIKQNRHGASLRIKTNGLIESKKCARVCEYL